MIAVDNPLHAGARFNLGLLSKKDRGVGFRRPRRRGGTEGSGDKRAGADDAMQWFTKDPSVGAEDESRGNNKYNNDDENGDDDAGNGDKGDARDEDEGDKEDDDDNDEDEDEDDDEDDDEDEDEDLDFGAAHDFDVEHYRALAAADPLNASALNRLGNLLERRGDDREAEEVYLRAVEVASMANPNDGSPLDLAQSAVAHNNLGAFKKRGMSSITN